MKKQETSKVISLKARIMAGVRAGLMFAPAVLGVIYYIVQ